MKTLDVVVLVRDVPGHGLRAGDVGTIVETYGPVEFAVEFIAASGRTRALATLNPQDVRAATDDDILATRLATAGRRPRLPRRQTYSPGLVTFANRSR
jgi:hypothetical protein